MIHLAIPILAMISASVATLEQEGESWERLTVEAGRIMECSAPGQDALANPVAAALERYDLALAEIDRSRSDNPVVAQTRGAERARITHMREILFSKQKAWDSSLQEAMKLLASHTPDLAAAQLAQEPPPVCWAAFRNARDEAEKERKSSIAEMAEGERLLESAHAALNLSSAVAAAAQAASMFRSAYDHNRATQRALRWQAEAERLRTESSKPSASNEIVIFSSPGGAVTLHGRKNLPRCGMTPCRIRFDDICFDPSGGSFLDSKRLLEPVIAEVSKPGFVPQRLILTTGHADWSGKMPGGRAHIPFYYFTQAHFEVQLSPSRPR